MLALRQPRTGPPAPASLCSLGDDAASQDVDAAAARDPGRMRRQNFSCPPLDFQGWRVAAGAFLVMAVGYGAAYSFAAFAPVLEQEFAASHASVSLVYSLCGFTAFGFSAISGPLADRVDGRILASVGMLLVGLGLWLSAGATSLLQLLLSYGLLIGFGIGFAYVPVVSAVQRWFVVWRGLASGIAASGIGFGTALVPPAAAALIQFGGWRQAFLMLAAAACLIGIAGASMIARSPESRGLLPDGEAAGDHQPAREAPPGGAVVSVLRQRSFAALYLGCFAVSIPVGLPFAHLPAFANGHGMPWSGALSLLSLIGFGSIAGRFLLGAVADWVGRRQTFLACCWGIAAATAWWGVAKGIVALSVFALAFGVTYGGFVALLPAFTVDLFGRSSAGSMLGILYTSRALALLSGPAIIAATSAGFGLAWPVVVSALVGAIGALLLTRASGLVDADRLPMRVEASRSDA